MAQGVSHEVVDRRHGLHAGEPSAGHDEGEQRLVVVGCTLAVGFLQVRNQAVTHFDGVAQRLHREGMRLESGQAIEVGDRATGQHHVVEFDHVIVGGGAVTHGEAPAGEVDPRDIATQEPGARQQAPDRRDDMRDVDVAGGHLVQHRREQEEVLAADERYLDRSVSGKAPLEP